MKTKKNSIRRNLIVSATALVISIAMLIGTTFAWFTDSVTSGTNKIVAGNLDVVLEYAKQSDVQADGTIDDGAWKDVENAEDLFDKDTLWEPGHTELVYLRLKNTGTLALDYTLNVSPVTETAGINKKGKTFKLSDYLVFKTTDVVDTPAIYTDRTAARDAAGTNKKLNQATLQKTGTLLANTGYQYTTLIVYMPTSVGNDANYGTAKPSIELGVTLAATQAENEEDSFGSDYDKDADMTPDNGGKDALSYNFPVNVQQSGTIVRNADGTETLNGVTKLNGTSYVLRSNEKPSANYYMAKATIPASAVIDNGQPETTTNLVLTVTPTTKPYEVPVIENKQDSTALDVKVTGIVDNIQDPITVQLYIGKKLNNLQLYHGNDPMTLSSSSTPQNDGEYYYTANNGIVTFKTTSFSKFTAVYDMPAAVADGVAYPTLPNAWTYAPDGSTITLLNDSTYDGSGAVIGPDSDNLTIDLNGKTFTVGNQVKWLQVQKGGKAINLTIENGTIEFADGGKGCSIDVLNGSTLTLKDVVLNAKRDGIYVEAGSKLNVISSTITADNFAIATNANGATAATAPVTINVKDSTISTNGNSGDNVAICLNVPGTLTVEGGSITGDRQGAMVRGGTATFTKTTITSNGTYAGSEGYLSCAWGAGNEVPMAALVIGNRDDNSYQYATNCTLVGTTLNATGTTLYAYANAAADKGTTLTYDAASDVGTIQPDDYSNISNLTIGTTTTPAE